MTAKYKKQLTAFGFFLLFLVVWTLLVYQFSPNEIVERLGVRNGYTLAFVAAFLAGISTFTSAPYALVVITLGAGGFSPFFIGLVSALGLFSWVLRASCGAKWLAGGTSKSAYMAYGPKACVDHTCFYLSLWRVFSVFQ